MKAAAASPDDYIASLPEDRRAPVSALRAMLRKSLEKGFEEGMAYGMISYHVPLSRYPDTYNGQPLGVAALASQKGYMALYLMTVYGDPAERERFEAAYKATGKRFDMGKSCVRFKTLSDLPLDLVAETLRRVTVDGYIARYEEIRAETATGKRAAEKKPAAKTAPPRRRSPRPPRRRARRRSGRDAPRSADHWGGAPWKAGVKAYCWSWFA